MKNGINFLLSIARNPNVRQAVKKISASSEVPTIQIDEGYFALEQLNKGDKELEFHI